MAKKPFNELTFSTQKRYKNEGFDMRVNTGLDTETYKGYTRLICDDSGRFEFVDSFEQIMYFLTHDRFRKAFNWWFNIKFDFESIIKYLDYGQLLELYQTKELKVGPYYLKYLDKKFFSISYEKHNFMFYDLYNFLDTSLNKASAKFLKDSKLADLVDSSKLNVNNDYWKENEENIIKYCIKDADLTKRLADHFWNVVYTNMDYYPKRPFSKGKISEEYFLKICYIPTINNLTKNVLKYAYNSYFGGRFELLKKGYAEQMYSYDIKSAYPDEMRKLIDFSEGKWFEATEVDKDAYTGYYDCIIECNEPFFSPFIQKAGELSFFPNGRFKQFLVKRELDFIEDHFENTTIKVVKGYEFFPTEFHYPFKQEMERLFDWKETEKDEDIRLCVKIFMNALYGKTIQVSGDNNKIGKLFNPLYASEITAGTRIKLYELALQSPDDIIMFSTDSVHSMVPLKVPNKPGLGDFSKDFEGEGVYIMSDVYNLWNLDKNKMKSKLRGFALAVEKDIDSDVVMLKDILANMEEEQYTYTTNRPYHLGECLLHKKARKIADLNVFGTETKHININGDKKRYWFDSFKNGRECLKKQLTSIPLVVERIGGIK
jgi:hypothetical protein